MRSITFSGARRNGKSSGQVKSRITYSTVKHITETTSMMWKAGLAWLSDSTVSRQNVMLHSRMSSRMDIEIMYAASEELGFSMKSQT